MNVRIYTHEDDADLLKALRLIDTGATVKKASEVTGIPLHQLYVQVREARAA